MRWSSFLAGVVAGLILGGVAWAHVDEWGGVTYMVRQGGRGEDSTRNLTVARGWFAQRSDGLDSNIKAGLRGSALAPVELIERTCVVRVLDSYVSLAKP
jgi:hypothetical protein